MTLDACLTIALYALTIGFCLGLVARDWQRRQTWE
jgi:hypothetical protein